MEFGRQYLKESFFLWYWGERGCQGQTWVGSLWTLTPPLPSPPSLPLLPLHTCYFSPTPISPHSFNPPLPHFTLLCFRALLAWCPIYTLLGDLTYFWIQKTWMCLPKTRSLALTSLPYSSLGHGRQVLHPSVKFSSSWRTSSIPWANPERHKLEPQNVILFCISISLVFVLQQFVLPQQRLSGVGWGTKVTPLDFASVLTSFRVQEL